MHWIAETTQRPVSWKPEPYVPAWNYTVKRKNPATKRREPVVVEARLDGHFTEHSGRLAYTDVCIPAAYSEVPATLHDRAKTPGLAAEQAVQGKHKKYPEDKNPTASLWAFAIESLGRPSEEALQLLRQLAPTDPSERAHALKVAHYRMSTIIAMRQAELLMAAEGPSVYGRAPPKFKPKALWRPELGAGPLAGPPLRISLSRERAEDSDGEYVDETLSSLNPGKGPPGWAEQWRRPQIQ